MTYKKEFEDVRSKRRVMKKLGTPEDTDAMKLQTQIK